jgi:hypothetical protein
MRYVSTSCQYVQVFACTHRSKQAINVARGRVPPSGGNVVASGSAALALVVASLAQPAA